ncbi:MAG TPA: hypothetical protein VN638_05905 [Nitrospiraceae bacterium]|nr:hypothetical protein [Nitrospiraceae bacterium]
MSKALKDTLNDLQIIRAVLQRRAAQADGESEFPWMECVRVLMRVLITVVGLGLAAWELLSDPGNARGLREWSAGLIGVIAGYWLKR